MGAAKKIGLILLTIFIPPLGVFFVAGCGADLLINIGLTVLGYAFPSFTALVLWLTSRASYFPGHIHAFYLEYVYFKRRDEAKAGVYTGAPAPGVYSQKVQRGGLRSNAGAAQGYPTQQYGTVG
jgi:uncharacterized membrane protein YqaE (UPF0057 family)